MDSETRGVIVYDSSFSEFLFLDEKKKKWSPEYWSSIYLT